MATRRWEDATGRARWQPETATGWTLHYTEVGTVWVASGFATHDRPPALYRWRWLAECRARGQERRTRRFRPV